MPKLRKASRELLALMAEGGPRSKVHYQPGREHATNSEARTRYSFERYNPASVGLRSYTRVTAPIERLITAGFVTEPATTVRRCEVTVTDEGRAWLDANA